MDEFRRRMPRYPDDSDYKTNAPSYYEDLARKNKLIQHLAEKIWEYEEKLTMSLSEIKTILDGYIEVIDGQIQEVDFKINEGFNTEIDSLLREWILDGTIDHIINETLMNKKADKTYVDTELAKKTTNVSTLKKMLTLSYLKENNQVVTNGYHNINDGGAGKYQIVNDPELVENGGTIHTLANGLKAVLQGDHTKLNVKQFGARGNDYHDDTEAIKTALKVIGTSSEQSLINFFGGGTLYFPAGIYIITNPLVVNVNTKIIGEDLSTWKFYKGRTASTTLRFKLPEKSMTAILVKGYEANGDYITGNYVTVEKSYTLKANPDNVTIKNINIESSGINALLGISFINAPSHRLYNVSIHNFQYSVLTNCSWGGSIEKLFSLSLYGGIISYLGSNGVSIKDSYITVTKTDIPTSSAIVPEVGKDYYPYKSFGIMGVQGTVETSNVIIESSAVSIKLIDSRMNINTIHSEEIKNCLFDVNNSLLSVTNSFLWNNTSTEISLLRSYNQSTSSLNTINSNNFSNIDASSSCKVNVQTSKKIKYSSYSPIHSDSILQEKIVFTDQATAVTSEEQTFDTILKTGNIIMLNLVCQSSTERVVGEVISIGVIPEGFRPYKDLVFNTLKGELKLTTKGGIILTLETATEDRVIVKEHIHFLG